MYAYYYAVMNNILAVWCSLIKIWRQNIFFLLFYFFVQVNNRNNVLD